MSDEKKERILKVYVKTLFVYVELIVISLTIFFDKIYFHVFFEMEKKTKTGIAFMNGFH